MGRAQGGGKTLNRLPKTRKATHACVRCQAKKCKCIPTRTLIQGQPSCEGCFKKNLICTFKEQLKRGPVNLQSAKLVGDKTENKIPNHANADNIWIHKSKTLPVSVLNLPFESDSDTEHNHERLNTLEEAYSKEVSSDNMTPSNWSKERNGEILFEYLLYGYNGSDGNSKGVNDNYENSPRDKTDIIKECFEITARLKRNSSADMKGEILSLENLLKKLVAQLP